MEKENSAVVIDIIRKKYGNVGFLPAGTGYDMTGRATYYKENEISAWYVCYYWNFLNIGVDFPGDCNETNGMEATN